LRGQELRCWLFRIRAQAGDDVAIDLLLGLADREPPK
jgi:hypothetical protein